jgi:hypothetical protein
MTMRIIPLLTLALLATSPAVRADWYEDNMRQQTEAMERQAAAVEQANRDAELREWRRQSDEGYRQLQDRLDRARLNNPPLYPPPGYRPYSKY